MGCALIFRNPELLALILSVACLCGVFHRRRFIANLAKTLYELLTTGAIGIVQNLYRLLFHVCFDALDSFLETQLILDSRFAVGTVHLRVGCQREGLDIFCCGKSGSSGNAESDKDHFHIVLYFFPDGVIVCFPD